MDYTMVVVARGRSGPMQFIAAYAGAAPWASASCGRATALFVYDDLSKQAAPIASSPCSCAAPPDARRIPGDVFYFHSRLLERA